jgi:hypothetical protein
MDSPEARAVISDIQSQSQAPLSSMRVSVGTAHYFIFTTMPVPDVSGSLAWAFQHIEASARRA